MKTLSAKVARQTLKILKTREWESISVDMIFKNLKLKDRKNSKKIKNKNDILNNINKFFDDSMINEIKKIEKSTSRDMIFEIFMLRYDLLNQYRKSVLKIFNVFKSHPKNFIFLLPSFIESIEMMAKYANIKTKGFVGVVKLKGLLIIYFSTFLIWLNDESDSLERTMTSLDNSLNQIENVLKLYNK